MKLLKKTYALDSPILTENEPFTFNAINESRGYLCTEHSYVVMHVAHLQVPPPSSETPVDLGIKLWKGVVVDPWDYYVKESRLTATVYAYSFTIPDPFGLPTEIEESLLLACLCPGPTHTPNGGWVLAEKMRTTAFDELSNLYVSCPLCKHGTEFWSLIQHLNDDHKWSREDIADWIEDLAEKKNLDISFPMPED